MNVAELTLLLDRLLASPAHELTAAKTVDRLDKTAFELITLDFPGDVLHAGLEGQRTSRQAGEQGQQG